MEDFQIAQEMVNYPEEQLIAQMIEEYEMEVAKRNIDPRKRNIQAEHQQLQDYYRKMLKDKYG